MKKLLSILIFLFLYQISYSQTEDNEYGDQEEETEFVGIEDKKTNDFLCKLRFSADIGILFGNNTFIAEFSPLIGYQIIKDRLEIGPGIVYQHESRSNSYAVNNIGGQAYIRGYLFQGIFAQVDGFLVNYNIKYLGTTSRSSSFTYGNGFIGAGYAFNHKEAPFYLSISLKTNIIIDDYYPTRRIIPKLGFQFKFCQ